MEHMVSVQTRVAMDTVLNSTTVFSSFQYLLSISIEAGVSFICRVCFI